MATINQLSAISSPNSSDLMVVYSLSNGDTRKMTLANLLAWLSPQITAADDKVTKYAAPSATGFTVTVTDSSASQWLLLTPVAGYAAGTITLPASGNCVDRQEILVNCTQAVTTLTVAGNGSTVTGAPTTLAANDFFTLRFDAVTAAWYRVG